MTRRRFIRFRRRGHRTDNDASGPGQNFMKRVEHTGQHLLARLRHIARELSHQAGHHARQAERSFGRLHIHQKLERLGREADELSHRVAKEVRYTLRQPAHRRALAIGVSGIFVLLVLLQAVSPVPQPRRGPEFAPIPAPEEEPTPPAPLRQHGPVPQPTISLRIVGTGRTVRLSIEEYVTGVVAGEVPNNWPRAVLEAQAILARTFIMRQIEDGVRSRYGTDASTDVTEFQAYRPRAINAAIRQAVRATRGQVLTYNGKMAHAFFHSCSGGTTATALEGLGITRVATPYLTAVTDGPCDSPYDYWRASFTAREVARAAGVPGFNQISIASHGPSGRAVTILVGSRHVQAIALRRALGPNRMKSTLLTSISLRGGRVHMTGRGWGHGVGMSQWGARMRALQGQNSAQILRLYYPGTILERIWQ